MVIILNIEATVLSWIRLRRPE